MKSKNRSFTIVDRSQDRLWSDGGRVIVFLLTFMVSALAVAGRITAGPIVKMEGQAISVEGHYAHPLTGAESCFGPNPASGDVHRDWWPYAGTAAYWGAVDQALNACAAEFFAGCNVISARYYSVASQEFPGYKSCVAVVVVHGYRMATGRK